MGGSLAVQAGDNTDDAHGPGLYQPARQHAPLRTCIAAEKAVRGRTA
jgi:hypothetical protein